jgi:general L-amino acid transport system substrate-binding protein
MSQKLFCVLMLCALLLSACSSGTAPAAPAATQAPAAPAATAAPAVAATQGASAPAGYGATLKTVLARGKILVGTQDSSQAFAKIDSSGNFTGFDADFSRAVAAAVFGDKSKVEFVVVTGETRFPMLQNGDTDVLIRNSTFTFSRDTELGFTQPMIYFYDGQGILAAKKSGFKSLDDMNGATICMGRGTTTEANIADAMGAKNLKYTPLLFDSTDDMYAAFEQGRCDAATGDRSGLVSDVIKMKSASDYTILESVTLSKEPFSPFVRHGDDQWADIVKWAFYVPIIAEENGITQANVDDMKANSQNPEVRRLLGVEGDMGKKLGLSNDWAYNIIKAVGNYGEIYDRSLGKGTATYLPRGINNLWKNGGLIYAPPFR